MGIDRCGSRDMFETDGTRTAAVIATLEAFGEVDCVRLVTIKAKNSVAGQWIRVQLAPAYRHVSWTKRAPLGQRVPGMSPAPRGPKDGAGRTGLPGYVRGEIAQADPGDPATGSFSPCPVCCPIRVAFSCSLFA